MEISAIRCFATYDWFFPMLSHLLIQPGVVIWNTLYEGPLSVTLNFETKIKRSGVDLQFKEPLSATLNFEKKGFS